jgi:hypothetical protein
MKKLIISAFSLCVILHTGNGIYAQSSTAKLNKDALPTTANVLRWAKEAQPHFTKIVKKLEKVKIQRPKDIEKKRLILQANKTINTIIATGDKLSATDAAKYDKWFRDASSKWIDDCLEENPGSECCFSCRNGGTWQGWGNAWCAANCFVFQFPDF